MFFLNVLNVRSHIKYVGGRRRSGVSFQGPWNILGVKYIFKTFDGAQKKKKIMLPLSSPNFKFLVNSFENLRPTVSFKI